MNKCLNYSCSEIKYGSCCADFTTFLYIVTDSCCTQSEEKEKNKEKYNLRPLAQRNWVKIFSTKFYLNRPNNIERSVRNSLTPLRKVCLSLS